MYKWDVYYEEADGNDEARFIGTIQADTMSQALEQAAQYYEVPSHDLIVRRSTIK
jgi:L-ribulose-5-phosphate 3-epimerase UlaE